LQKPLARDLLDGGEQGETDAGAARFTATLMPASWRYPSPAARIVKLAAPRKSARGSETLDQDT